jgi:iron-sulfur cluster repair protein YtfE (RIC family)
MKKAFLASFYSLTAIACALWLFLYTIINDIMRDPFKSETIVSDFRLFGPMVVFAFCCLGYVRIRRAMDKEKIAQEKLRELEMNDLMFVAPNELVARALLDLLPEGKLSKDRVGDELTTVLDELRFTYYRFYRNGGRKENVALSMIELLERLDSDMPRTAFEK